MSAPPDLLVAEVRENSRLGPNVVRIVLDGGDLPRYPMLDVPDEAVALYFPSGDAPVGRNYTVRAFDPGTARMTVDFVLHEGGVAAQWALGATPGDRVRLARPRSWYRRPADSRWQLLVADLTGLPALARILEGCDGTVATRAVVEVLDDADLATLPGATPPGVTMEVLRGGNGVGPSALVERACAVEPPDEPGYLWFAGEAGGARQIRKHARHVWSWTTDRMDVIGYWRLAAERWNARFAPVSTELLAVYQAVLDNGGSDKEAGEAYDIALEQAGL